MIACWLVMDHQLQNDQFNQKKQLNTSSVMIFISSIFKPLFPMPFLSVRLSNWIAVNAVAK